MTMEDDQRARWSVKMALLRRLIIGCHKGILKVGRGRNIDFLPKKEV
jgi:hypothetical protein